MALINQATKEIQLKIVYYGPPQGGKTTNLENVHAEVDAPPEVKGKLTSLATNSDRTLFFDFLPLETAVIRGYKTKSNCSRFPDRCFTIRPGNWSCAGWTDSFSWRIRSTTRWRRMCRRSPI